MKRQESFNYAKNAFGPALKNLIHKIKHIEIDY